MTGVNPLLIAVLILVAAAYTLDILFLVVGGFAIKNQRRDRLDEAGINRDFPPITILIPCFNEENTIISTLDNLLRIDYPLFDIIVINDGSTDSTMNVLQNKLRLIPSALPYTPAIPTQPVKGMYRSRYVTVADKVNGGKADSLNVGLNLCRNPLVCCIDADTIIKADALKKLVLPFLDSPDVVATGGTVRLKNGSVITPGAPIRLKTSPSLLTIMQVIEYIRSINISRCALAAFNANIIVSGAFAVFRSPLLKEIGGYETFSKGEDIELILRIHLHMNRKKLPYRIIQVYDADAFTDGPAGIKALKSQRKRWQVGLVGTLRAHLLKAYKYAFPSPITLFTLPYYIVFEIVSPILQAATYVLLPLLVLTEALGREFLSYLLIVFLYGSLVNMLNLTLEFFFSGYYHKTDQWDLSMISCLEPFFYHQMNCYWKMLGTLDSVKKVFVKSSWTPPRHEDNLKSRLGFPDTGTVGVAPSTGRLVMEADYKTLSADRIVIITFAGDFSREDIGSVDDTVLYFKSKKRKRFIFEMKALNNISPDALDFLVRLTVELKKENGGLVILKPLVKIEDQLKISNAVRVVKIFKNYSDAVMGVKYG